MMKTTTEPKHKFFMKIMTTQVLKPYLKEAKRVGYTVKGGIKDGFVKVITDECASHPAGEVVMRGTKAPWNPAWIMSFNTEYWVEPSIKDILNNTKEMSNTAAALLMIPSLVDKKTALQKLYAETHLEHTQYEMHTLMLDIGPMDHAQLDAYINKLVKHWQLT
jgi:hypothetical protein